MAEVEQAQVERFWRNRSANERNNSLRGIHEARKPIWKRRWKCGEWFLPKRQKNG